MFAGDTVICCESRKQIEETLRDGNMLWKEVEVRSVGLRQYTCE